MSFVFPTYHHPDFSKEPFLSAPQAQLKAAVKEGVVPEGYHATTIYP